MCKNESIWKSVINFDLIVPFEVYGHRIWRDLPVGHHRPVRLDFIVPHDAISTPKALFSHLLSKIIDFDVIFVRNTILLFQLTFIKFFDWNSPYFAGFVIPFNFREFCLAVDFSIVPIVFIQITIWRILFEDDIILPNFIL